MHLRTSSTAPCEDDQTRVFKITHPFHPSRDRQLDLVTYRQNWGEDRIFYYNTENELISVPAQWTDLLDPDPFVTASSGRALFRTDELIDLVMLIEELDRIADRIADREPEA